MHANLNLLNIVTRAQEMHSEFNSSNVAKNNKIKKNIAMKQLLIEMKSEQN